MTTDSNMVSKKAEIEIPLCVDLDFTLIKTDLLFEQLLKLLKLNPLKFFLIPFWLLRGRAYLKKQLRSIIDFSVTNIPLNDSVVSYCQEQYSLGRKLYLVTGTEEGLARKFKGKFAFFKEIFGTTEQVNLIGKNKAEFLVQKFGAQGFDYVGDSRQDLKVWKVARKAIVVSNSSMLINQIDNIDRIITRKKNNIRSLLREIRIHQWSKNLLILMPMIMSNNFLSLGVWQNAIVAIGSFCLAASGVYLLNDLFDLENDRAHPTKKNRPLALGDLSIPVVFITSILFIATGVIIGTICSYQFVIILAFYLILNYLYSSYFKNILILNIFILTCFYLLRIIAGSVATELTVSPWLMLLSLFFFAEINFLKRYTEMQSLKDDENLQETKSLIIKVGQDNEKQESMMLLIFGCICGYASVLIFSLHIFQPEIINKYSYPDFLWIVSALMLYWTSMMWMRASKGVIKEDILRYVLTDIQSIVLFIIGIIVIFISN